MFAVVEIGSIFVLPISTDMTQTTLGSSKFIKVSNYRPTFAKNAIVKTLQKAGFDVEVKLARTTNSAYITGDKDGRYFEIRVSDHSQAIDVCDKFYSDEEAVYKNYYDMFEADVFTAAHYAELKTKLAAWIALN